MAETGHARNVERFAQMISFVQGVWSGLCAEQCGDCFGGFAGEIGGGECGD